MKTFVIRLGAILALLATGTISVAQVEIKGSGTTSATSTLITKNGSNDTSMIIRDDGSIGIGTTNPMTRLDVNGVINAGSGVRYPDGLTQTIAYTGPPVSPANTFVVATTGGDFTTITDAILACTAPSAANPYLVEVMPGTYVENVNCVQFVNLRGAGKYASRIQGTVVTADSMVIEGFNIALGIQCPVGSPTILHNAVTNTPAGGGIGINVLGMASPWIKENEITGCSAWGIIVMNATAWIIANKVQNNMAGGIQVFNSSPTISNNIIDNNDMYGINVSAPVGMPVLTTISDNVISNTDYTAGGIGISLGGTVEPMIISNDIRTNETGIYINPNAQPSINGNNINNNYAAGIRCLSAGTTKRVVITGNHIHSNIHFPILPGPPSAGIWIAGPSDPIITLNNISQNNVAPAFGLPDIDYSAIAGAGPFPTISSNIYDMILRLGFGPGPGPAMGMYNSTLLGVAIFP